MKVPLKWLKEYVDISLQPADLAERLTIAGSEVKGLQVIGAGWEDVMVGKILAVDPHPNADRLSLPTVDLGTEQQTVVCGAPNLKVGDKIAFARVGAQLIDGHSGQVARLKSTKIRGVLSSGMVCSEKELGISDNHTEILVLPAEAPLGQPLADYLGDVIFDLDITPNRPDCLSIIGIAREASALTGQSLHLPRVEYKEESLSIDQKIAVEIIAPDLCPRYCASLITGVNITESPQWLQQMLLACGMRPINNVVDITNYVMLEYGQPLHAFDYEQIRGRKIIVRRAVVKEKIVTLDEVERVLSNDMLVIADGKGAVAIAGIMGGAESEVTQETTSILLEAASFDPASIHYTGRVLHLPSEACMRFERGIAPELTLPALKRATQLLVQLAGGRSAKGVVDACPGKQKHEPIMLSTSQVARLLGVEFGLDQIAGTLVSLGFQCEVTSESEVRVTAPYWRSDIHQAYDLIEEVARIIGYDKIPTTMLSQSLPRQNPEPIFAIRQKVRERLIGFGFQEVITYSLTSLEMLRRLLPTSHSPEPMPLRMANPMTVDQEYLRPNLRANLLASLSKNRKHDEESIRLFELGKVYLPHGDDLPDEPDALCGALSGPRLEKSWRGGDESFDFYSAKGVVESIFSRLGVSASFEEGEDESLHPHRQAAIIIDGGRLGVFGELHPKVAEAFEIPGVVYLFEIDLTALLPHATAYKMFRPVPRFPAILRDVALIVDAGVIQQKVLDVIQGFALVNRATLFDVYTGEQVAAGKKSLAYRISFQSPTDTLTDSAVDRVQHQILKKLSRELGAILRR
ncbi:phenylalanine--tRNA ligase subunit beta [Chloroflexota bacterium]